MNRNGISALALAALLMPSGLAHAAVELMADGNVGNFRIFLVLNGKMALAAPDGRTLYTYAKDPERKATCTGTCAQQWPPLLAGGEQGLKSFSVFAREDGRLQWAFEGKPLYMSVKDTAPGDALGHGIDDAWSIVEVPGHEM